MDGLDRIDPAAMLEKVAALQRDVFGEDVYELEKASDGICPDCKRDNDRERRSTPATERWLIGRHAYCWDCARSRRRVARKENA